MELTNRYCHDCRWLAYHFDDERRRGFYWCLLKDKAIEGDVFYAPACADWRPPRFNLG